MLPGQENRSPIHNLECDWDSQPANYKENQQVIRGMSVATKRRKNTSITHETMIKGKNIDYMQKNTKHLRDLKTDTSLRNTEMNAE